MSPTVANRPPDAFLRYTYGAARTPRKIAPLGRWRWPISAVVLTLLFLGAVVPIVMLVWQSLQLRLGDYSRSNLKVQHDRSWEVGSGDAIMVRLPPKALHVFDRASAARVGAERVGASHDPAPADVA